MMILMMYFIIVNMFGYSAKTCSSALLPKRSSGEKKC